MRVVFRAGILAFVFLVLAAMAAFGSFLILQGAGVGESTEFKFTWDGNEFYLNTAIPGVAVVVVSLVLMVWLTSSLIRSDWFSI